MKMKKKAWVITVDMGYGHQRASHPLRDIAYERIITANSDAIVSKKEQGQWHRFKRYYEGISRLASVPYIGKPLFDLYDRFQSISPYYPFRDLSKPSLQSFYMHRMINKGFMRCVVDYTKKKDLPFVSTFFGPALAAAHAGRKDIYLVVTDTDINRAWVPEFPKKEMFYYCVPSEHSAKRLEEYGVPKKDIFFTGFPLPKENTGTNMEILKSDIGRRLPNLDPNKRFTNRYWDIIKKELKHDLKKKSDHPLTLTFPIGGAGAQTEIGEQMLESLKKKIKEHKIRVNFIAGVRMDVEQQYLKLIEEKGLSHELGKYVDVLCSVNKSNLFDEFNEMLRTTDILWTKPSELSFYCALGIPIIIAPPLGAHEVYNKDWLMKMGTGIPQEDPMFADDWLFEWIENGLLAEAAWEGFIEAPKFGTYNIEKLIFSKNKDKIKFKY
jgi:hypothetical protein